MRYDELEHEGDEDFIFQNRGQEVEIKKVIKEKSEKIKEEIKQKEQETWLSVNNPFIWDGDPDV